jgi:hypothetical protein
LADGFGGLQEYQVGDTVVKAVDGTGAGHCCHAYLIDKLMTTQLSAGSLLVI